jgi:hypothetical protein
MARRLRSPKLENRTSRLRLAIRKKPYSASIAPGVVLQYRRNKGPGAWGVRLTSGKDQTHRLGTADDYADADGRDVLDYLQAHDAARAKAREYEGTSAPVTVAKALAEYEADLKVRNGDTGNVVRARGHLSAEMLDRTVSSLNAAELKRWRDGLAKHMAPASANRTATCLKAALNLAADHDERIARRPWETGLAAIPGAERSRNAVLVLNEATVRAIVEEAYTPRPVDESEPKARREAKQAAMDHAAKFGLLVEVLAVTGTRVSQSARLTVADAQGERNDPRLMMPTSKKGKGVKKISRRPVPIPVPLALKLRAAGKDRAKNAHLLTKPNGEPWKKSDHSRPFKQVIDRLREKARAEARKRGESPEKAAAVYDGVTIYAFRHTSIVRQILANVPIRIVAVNHDTSVKMIEQNYSAFIADHSDALSRKALLDLSVPPVDNVVTLQKVAAQ